jgi:hypothetical protein
MFLLHYSSPIIAFFILDYKMRIVSLPLNPHLMVKALKKRLWPGYYFLHHSLTRGNTNTRFQGKRSEVVFLAGREVEEGSNLGYTHLSPATRIFPLGPPSRPRERVARRG